MRRTLFTLFSVSPHWMPSHPNKPFHPSLSKTLYPTIQVMICSPSIPKKLTFSLREAISEAVGLATILLCALLMLSVASARAQSAGLRLMPIGDSITVGYLSSTGNGYRGPLYDELVSQGDALDMVGSQRSGSMFDPDNEGYYGYEISQIAGLINPKLANYQPNLVTLLIGVNDLKNGDNVSTAPSRLASLIDQIIAADPTVTLLVGQLPVAADPTTNSRITTYNSQIPGIVQTRVNVGKHVYTVSMSSLTTADLSDGLHPNDGGYQKMADAWDAAIKHVISVGWVASISFAGRFEIVNVASGLTMDVQGKSTANDAPVIQWAHNGGSNQLWNFIPTSGGYYQISNCLSSKVLTIYGASTGINANAVQDPYGSAGNDQWQPVKQSDGSYVLYNRHSGLVLDNPGGGATQGTEFIQYNANGGSNQKFTVTAK